MTEDFLNSFLWSVESSNTVADVAGVLLQEADASPPLQPQPQPPAVAPGGGRGQRHAAATAAAAAWRPRSAGAPQQRPATVPAAVVAAAAANPRQMRRRPPASFVEESHKVVSPPSGADADVGDFLDSFADRYGSKSALASEPKASPRKAPAAVLDLDRPADDPGDIDALLGVFSSQ